MGKSKPLATITFYSSSTLFRIAKTACQRTTGGQAERQGGQNDAVVAVIFASAALEAFINELGQIAGDIIEQRRAFQQDVQRAGRSPSGPAPVPPFVGALTTVIQQLEESKGQVQLKYDMAMFVLRGEMYSHGTQPYQDFSDLIRLRNAIMHIKRGDQYEFGSPTNPGLVPTTMDKVMEGLWSRNVLAEPPPGEFSDWLDLLGTQAVAKWACNAASAIVLSVLDAIPDSILKGQANRLYRSVFQPVA
jgi:hypothetical protein